ncbi:FecR family protein [Chitinophaga polysaccharea]|uniref:FecR family protein n=1 Tax=Chitinophaga polysaccharea TaxID=1293035 RepID=A0A561P412_9BACT|nr:FecR family protein [Chitinophaga polysaccharea]TWF32838.1 FecR family protein [Chitinophaga polysaccharea]
MMDNRERELFKLMLNRFRTGNATGEEIVFLESWFDLHDTEEELITAENESAYEDMRARLKSRIDAEIAEAVLPTQLKRMPVWRWAAAAAIVAVIGIGAVFFLRQQQSTSQRSQARAYATGAPTLRLADGTVIALDSAAGGQIASQRGVVITKEKDGTLLYKTTSAEKSDPNQENVLSTPAGTKFKIVLPDNSTVWLNAASTLKYPAAFDAANRTVRLTGEAYFDIAADPARPFVVQAGQQSIQVLGTVFNVNAYPEDGLSKTTLLQGAVKVSHNGGSVVIQPGQQAICEGSTGNSIQTITADTEKETAWINNLFSFKNDNLPSVMRDVARWYNVQIRYSGHIPEERFFGEISRNSKLEDVLKILEINGITFEVKDNVITVTNKN